MLSTIQKLMLAFVTLIIGLVLVGQVATVGTGVTTLTTTTETVDFSAARVAGAINATYYFHLKNGCPLSGGNGWRYDAGETCYLVNGGVKNNSGTVLTDTVDYYFNEYSSVCTGTTAGDIHFENTAKMNNSGSNLTSVTYSYCADGFLTQSWQRNVLQLVPGFFALALLIFSVGMFYSVARDSGIL
jgi:hypothetical protein